MWVDNLAWTLQHSSVEGSESAGQRTNRHWQSGKREIRIPSEIDDGQAHSAAQLLVTLPDGCVEAVVAGVVRSVVVEAPSITSAIRFEDSLFLVAESRKSSDEIPGERRRSYCSTVPLPDPVHSRNNHRNTVGEWTKVGRRATR